MTIATKLTELLLRFDPEVDLVEVEVGLVLIVEVEVVEELKATVVLILLMEVTKDGVVVVVVEELVEEIDELIA